MRQDPPAALLVGALASGALAGCDHFGGERRDLVEVHDARALQEIGDLDPDTEDRIARERPSFVAEVTADLEPIRARLDALRGEVGAAGAPNPYDAQLDAVELSLRRIQDDRLHDADQFVTPHGWLAYKSEIGLLVTSLELQLDAIQQRLRAEPVTPSS